MYLGISQSIFVAILMLTKKGAGVSDKLLTGWLFLLGIEFATCAIDLFYFQNALLSSVFLLINPAFFLYIKALTNIKFRLKYIQLLHLIPYLVFEIATYFIREPFSIQMLTPGYHYFWFSLSFSIANILSWIFYNLYSILLVHRHRINLKNEFSTIDPNTNIAWLLFVLIFYFLYCSFALITGILALNFDRLAYLPSAYNYSMMLGLTYILGFYGLRQRQIFTIKDPLEKGSKETLKYKSSMLTERDKKQIKESILSYFEKKKPYLNPDFNMTLLSKNLNLPKHHITEVLNMDIGKNFFNFVNEYRVEAVKKMLVENKLPYSIEAIGYECGFNSKSSFFTVFKTITGMTPLEFKIKKL